MKTLLLGCNSALIGCCLLFGSMACSSCGSQSNPNTEQVDSEQVDSTRESTISGEPKSAIIYFDKSHSMKGYLDVQKEPRFIGMISSLFSLVKDTKVYMHGEKPEPKALTANDFLNKLNNKQIEYSDESNLFNMIESMLKAPTDVSFLVTDGIMSGSNKQIRENSTYSINSREAMSNQIKTLVKDYKGTKAALVIRSLSNFSGIYYTYNNTKKNLKDKERPFFIICIGSPLYIKYIEQEMLKMEDASKCQMVLLGEDYKNVFKLSRRSGLKIGADKKTMMFTKDSCSFSANITKLPLYMRTSDYLEKYLVFNTQNNVVATSKYNISIVKETAIIEMAKLGQLTGGGTLSYTLKFEMPEWITKYSTDDDSNIGGLLGADQTFNLQYLIKGLMDLNIDNDVANGFFKFKK